jgi:EmrB/QacA subfamily drug resistance transporter
VSERAPRARWFALVALCTGMLMIVVDQTIVNVALPAIQRDLGFSQSNLAWVVNAYLIAYGGLLLLSGRIGDLIGRKRIFITGLVLFTAASLLCGISTSAEMLVAARFVQGVAGAVASAVILGMVVTLFPEPREQARAIGVFSFVAAIGGSIGLLAGGVLTQAINWHWIFLVNLPIGIAAAVLGARLLEPERGIGLARGADLAGALLITSALMLGIYTIVETERYGWLSAHTLGLGSLALALLAAFVARQATARAPLVPLRVFRSRGVAGANLIGALMVPGMFGFFFLGTLYLQRVLGYGALGVGLAILPVTLVGGVLSLRVSARLNVRFGLRAVLLPSLVVIALGLAWFVRAPVHGTYATDVLPAMLALGVGAGLGFPALMSLAMADATPGDAGLASGLINTTQMVSGALGLAVLVTLAASHTARLLAAGTPLPAALTGGYHLAFALGTALVAAALLVAALAVTGRERTSETAQGPMGALPVADQRDG